MHRCSSGHPALPRVPPASSNAPSTSAPPDAHPIAPATTCCSADHPAVPCARLGDPTSTPQPPPHLPSTGLAELHRHPLFANLPGDCGRTVNSFIFASHPDALDEARAWHVSRSRSEAPPMLLFIPDPFYNEFPNPPFSFAFRGRPSYGFGSVHRCVCCSVPVVLSLTFDNPRGHEPLVTRMEYANAGYPDGTAFGWDLPIVDAEEEEEEEYTCCDCA